MIGRYDLLHLFFAEELVQSVDGPYEYDVANEFPSSPLAGFVQKMQMAVIATPYGVPVFDIQMRPQPGIPYGVVVWVSNNGPDPLTEIELIRDRQNQDEQLHDWRYVIAGNFDLNREPLLAPAFQGIVGDREIGTNLIIAPPTLAILDPRFIGARPEKMLRALEAYAGRPPY